MLKIFLGMHRLKQISLIKLSNRSTLKELFKRLLIYSNIRPILKKLISVVTLLALKRKITLSKITI